MGKTRLALELAGRLDPPPADGGWLVDLAAGADGWDVAAETARALAIRSRAGAAAIDALCRYFDPLDAVLVLDNCEHVVDSCAELAAALISRCARLRIVATSLEPLGIEGETVMTVDPLEAEDASRLFVERARQRGRTSSWARTMRRWWRSSVPGSIVCRWGSSWRPRGRP